MREDIARVELWADALGCFARPIPDYDPGETNLNKFALTSGSPLRQQDGAAHAASGGNGKGKNSTAQAARN